MSVRWMHTESELSEAHRFSPRSRPTGSRQTGSRQTVLAALIALLVCVALAGCNGSGTPMASSGTAKAAGKSPAVNEGATREADEKSADADGRDGATASTTSDGGEAEHSDAQPADAGGEDNVGSEEAADETNAEGEPNASQENDASAEEDGLAARNPFAHRIDMPAFPEGLEWLNTKPIELKDLRGKFVVLDFWTYCCINCMHILPELKKLEEAYPNNVVVIGVHSAKFETEKDSKNIAEAIMRYKIEHPVVNDRDHVFWNSIGVNSWPTLVLIDPEGKVVWARPGEVEFELLDQLMKIGLPYYREQKLLDEHPLRFELLEYTAEQTPLRYPGKVLADEASKRLFITDSNHNRIVVAGLDGAVQAIIGSGQEGTADGSFAECSFKQPQGVALHGETLYVADTENHLIRKVDLAAGQVSTIAGTGVQGRSPWPGLDSFDPQTNTATRWVGKPLETAINSPWALLVHEQSLYIAMAGPHQIWRMPLDETEIGPYAGNGREDIVDGPLLPAEPYAEGAASFAQPSGLATDGTWLYVADSEGSSIRAVPFDPNASVRTVVGTAHLPFGRLFEFGDVDGEPGTARLQHCLGVAYHEGQVYVADAYNHKIKVVDAETGVTKTLVGTGESGLSDDPPQFHEPAGISYAAGKLYVADTNNHRICTVNLADLKVETLTLAGLQPPERKTKKPSFADAEQVAVPPVTLRPEDGHVTLTAKVKLPTGWKMNEAAPQQYWLETRDEQGVVDRKLVGVHPVDPPSDQIAIRLPVSGPGEDEVTISLTYFYCESAEGLCKIGSVVWTVPLTVAYDAPQTTATLEHTTPGPRSFLTP